VNAGLMAMAYVEATLFAAEHGDKAEEVRCHEIASALTYLLDHNHPLPAAA